MSEDAEIKYINLPLQYEKIKSDVIDRVKSVFENGDFVLGQEVKLFEKRFAEYCKCKYATGLGSGTDALFLGMKSLGIGPGDEVITVPNSFISTAASIANVGAKPVFADVKEDYNINPESIQEVISDRTKAIIPVHLTGRPVDMSPITEISEDHDLFVIEDAAQAVGAEYKGKKVGSFGDVGCFSLHPLKNLSAAGDAGIIITNNFDIYKKITKLRNHGLRNRDMCDFWGYNSRLDSIQAAILNVKINYLDLWNEKIKKIAKIYQENLEGVVDFPKDKKYEKSVYHLFMIQCDRRDELQRYLLKKGIETKIHYPVPIHLQQPAKLLGYKKGYCPVAELQAKRILSLPIYPELSRSQAVEVTKNIQEFYSNRGKTL